MNLNRHSCLKSMTLILRTNVCRCCSEDTSARNKASKSKQYSDTLNLPKTAFPLSQRGNAISKREVEVQKRAGFDSLYSWQQSQGRKKTFVLHDGPPYANGKPHVGHTLNKVLKDITNRYKLLRGYKVHYIPGWDCHGLPIEMKALTSADDFRTMDPLKTREKARQFANRTIEEQKRAFKRWGVMADWDMCYLTQDKMYQANQLDVFYQMYDQGLVYRDVMPVYWSPSSRTALAESELEYESEHVSTAAYVRLPLKEIPAAVTNLTGADQRVYVVIWTTTPWTIPANKAVCYKPNLRYIVVKGVRSGVSYLCGEEFLEKIRAFLNEDVNVLGTILGSDLEGSRYKLSLTQETCPLLPADHVTAEKGTGLVHTAPAHGHDDYKVAQKHALQTICIVDEDGIFTRDAGELLAGLNVLDSAGPEVISLLGEDVLRLEKYTHSYPYDWRTKQPVIIRTSKQWFINTQTLQQRALDCMKDVRIRPPFMEKGMLSQIESRTYWCISRQRAWGVPIPVFYTKDTDRVIINSDTMEHVKTLVQKHGSDCWWSMSIDQLFPSLIAQKAGLSSPDDCIRGNDILDIWFDSGTSWYSVLKGVEYEADLCVEGIDQFRGWFLSSMLTSVAVSNKSPYKNLLAHGFAIFEDGRKMSKSEGNVIDPNTVINGGKDLKAQPAYGVDVLRWWVASSHLHSSVTIGPRILNQFYETVFKVRKCLRFLLGNLCTFDTDSDVIPYASLLPQDQYMLHLLYHFHQQCVSSYDDFNYSRVVQAVEKFVNAQVSHFYSSIIKDRCYCGTVNEDHRKSSLTVQFYILQVISKIIAPILPHLAEELYFYSPEIRTGSTPTTGEGVSVGATSNVKSIFREDWFEADPAWNNPDVQAEIEAVLSISDKINPVMGTERSTEFDVILHSSGALLNVLKKLQSEQTSSTSPLCELLQTSQTSVIAHPPLTVSDDFELVEGECQLTENEKPIHFTALVLPAENSYCHRCRRYTVKGSGDLCDRCVQVITR